MIDEGLLADFNNCKYKAVLRISGIPSQHPSEIDVLLARQRSRLRERWVDTLKEECASLNGEFSCLEDFRKIIGNVGVGSITLVFRGLRCHVDGLEVRGQSKGQRLLCTPILLSLLTQPSEAEKRVLAFASLIIGHLTGYPPRQGLLILGESHRRITVNLESRKNGLKKMIDEIGALNSANMESYFHLNRHCGECEFSTHCKSKAKDADHLSLLRGLSQKEAKKLNGKGIFTVTQYSYTFRPRRSRKNPTVVKNDHALRALAIRDGKTYVVQRPKLPSTGNFIFLDVEGIPERAFFYLIGVLVMKDGAKSFQQFWSDREEEQERIWRQFLDFINRFDGFTIIHHGKYDAVFLKKMQEKYGGLKENFLAERALNTLTLIYGKIYFPAYGNGLKEIAASFGFHWTDPQASGIQSIAWRLLWEESHSDEIKNKILQYNRQDCEALELLTAQLKVLEESKKSESVIICDEMKRTHHYRWGRNEFAFPELEVINKCAYFDYQHDKIFWRTSEEIRENKKREKKGQSRNLRINKVVTCAKPKRCPACSSQKIIKHQASHRVIYDLKFTGSGVKRWILKHKNHRFICNKCDKTFHPEGHPETKEKYGHNIIAWSIYQNIGLRQSQDNVAQGLNDIFGFNFGWRATIAAFKEKASAMYRITYNEILSRIRNGHLAHVDETRVSIKGSTGYVWVFTNLGEVAYVYSENREGVILREVLQQFQGVVVSDFYPAYDGLECKQQRCLVHLIRDLNDDLFKNQFDLEYKEFVRNFGVLLKSIILTIDRFGLKRYFLSRHKKTVAVFYKNYVYRESISEIAQKYQARFIKNKDRLFTFLDHDGVPWNNNNAENAIKGFATVRRIIGGSSTASGLRDTLTLLSICQTLRNKNCSSLDFFRSRETSLDRYLSLRK